MPAASSCQRLEHLDGGRFLAALWIVCAHYLPPRGRVLLNGAAFRVDVAVCFFVVCSGFVTHWAHEGRDLGSVRALGQFYARRLGRVVFTFWVAMAFACYVLTWMGTTWDTWYLLRCFLFVEQWVQWCPNGPSWFVFALLPSWLLYPVTRRLAAAAEARGGGRGLAALLSACWALSFGPAVALFLAQGGNITMQQHADMSFWPPAQLADFALGVAAAALARRQRRALGCDLEGWAQVAGPGAPGRAEGTARMSSCPLWLLADGCLVLVVATVLLLPRPSGTYQLHLNGWEPLLDHGFAPAFAGFLYATAASTVPAPGCGAKLMSHRALVALGTDSFEAYIFQRPLHDVFNLFFDTSSPQVFVAFVLTLWLFAGLYANYVQAPVELWIRWLTSGDDRPPGLQYAAVRAADGSSPQPAPAAVDLAE